MKKLSMDELDRKTVDEFKRSEKFPVIASLEEIKYFQFTVSVAPSAVLSISLRGGCAV